MRMRMKSLRVAKRLAFVGLLLIGCQSPDTTKQKLMRQAQHSAQMPSWEASKQSEMGMPDITIETYMAAGQLHEAQGRLAKAAAQYRMATQMKPDDAEIQSRLGLVLCQMRQFKEADAVITKAIKLAPDKAHLYNNLGFSYLIQARWTDAEQQFKKAVELNPEFARAHVNLGMVLAQQERFDEAMSHFQLVVPLEDAWFNIGLMYQSKSRQEEAARAFKTALKLRPELTAAQQCLKKLPPAVVDPAQPFDSVGAMALAASKQQPADEPTASPAGSLAETGQPPIEETTTPWQPSDDNMPLADSSDDETGEQSTPPKALADTEALETRSDQVEDEQMSSPDMNTTVADATESTPTTEDDESGAAGSLDPEMLVSLMNDRASELTFGGPRHELFDPSMEPEEDEAEWEEPTAVAIAPEVMSSTSQPSFTLPSLNQDAEMKELLALRRAVIDVETDLMAQQEDEIVLSARPPMPPQARNVVLQATRPADEAPTPEELRNVIEALLELSRNEANPEMPKPYSLPATRPAAAAPQSQPAAVEPSQVSMSVDISLDGPSDRWDSSSWDDFESLVSPADTFAPGDSQD